MKDIFDSLNWNSICLEDPDIDWSPCNYNVLNDIEKAEKQISLAHKDAERVFYQNRREIPCKMSTMQVKGGGALVV